jgi:AcrR family transcriptional regulator
MGKQRSSLYYYFSGKEAVVKALVDNELAEMSRAVRKQVDSQTNASGRLRTFLLARIEQTSLRCKVFGQILPEFLSGRDGAPDIFQLSEQRRAADEADQRYLAGIILQGIKDGQFSSLSKEEVNHFTHLIFSAMRGIELELLIAPEPMDELKPRLEVAFNILLRGLLR